MMDGGKCPHPDLNGLNDDLFLALTICLLCTDITQRPRTMVPYEAILMRGAGEELGS